MPKPTLLDGLRAAQANARGPGCLCPVGLILGRMSPDDADDLRTALADDGYTSTVIARYLNEQGLHPVPGKQLSDEAVRKHRRKVCGCGTR